MTHAHNKAPVAARQVRVEALVEDADRLADLVLAVREAARVAILASACAPALGYTQTHTRTHPLGHARTCVRADLPNRTIAHIA